MEAVLITFANNEKLVLRKYETITTISQLHSSKFIRTRSSAYIQHKLDCGESDKFALRNSTLRDQIIAILTITEFFSLIIIPLLLIILVQS